MQKYTLPTLQQHEHVFIAHSMPVVVVAWFFYCVIQTIRHPQTFLCILP